MLSEDSKSRQRGRSIRPSWFLLLICLVFCNGLISTAQTREAEGLKSTSAALEIEIPIIDKANNRSPGFGYCGYRGDGIGTVVEEATFRKLTANDSEAKPTFGNERCAFLNRLKVDFSVHTLFTYAVGGDCFVRARAVITRNDEARKYVLRITKIFGGCRAAGTFEQWLVVEKIRPDYEVEVQLFAQDESGATRRRDRRQDQAKKCRDPRRGT